MNMARWGQKYPLLPNQKVLEIGIGGDKELPSENFKYFPATNYYTMDVCREYKPTYVGDITSMPFDDNTYDLLICTQTLEHVWDTRKALAECYRVLKPGGRLLVDMPWQYPYHTDPDDYWRISHTALRRIAVEVGFSCESRIINDILTVAECRKSS